jgi:hypothetical protein
LQFAQEAFLEQYICEEIFTLQFAQEEFLEQYVRKRVPALLEGCTAGWPAQRAWTAESLLMEREGNSLWVSESRRRLSGNDEQQVGVALVKGTASRE